LWAANKDGGAHVDEKLPNDYVNLMEQMILVSQNNITGKKRERFSNEPFVVLRQAAYEISKSEELYKLVETGDSGAGLLEMFSVPATKFQCDNAININLSEGMVLFTDDDLIVDIPAGISMTDISIYNASGALIETVLGVTTWDPVGMVEGIYKVEVTVNDAEGMEQKINGVFIIKES